MSAENLISYIKGHPCYSHPIFSNWAKVNPEKEVVAALFHQIRCFCDSTRPVHNLPLSLIENGFSEESELVKSIAVSEENHGPELATMAGYILNKMSKEEIFSDLYDQENLEKFLKSNSDELLSQLPGYDKENGLLIQNKIARNVFETRKKTDKTSMLINLGITLALEMISNRQLIPGEKHCLIDSNLYNASLEDEGMHYLKEHWGEVGAEAMHEKTAVDAINTTLTAETKDLIFRGAKVFLDSLASLWNTLDSALLGSGYLHSTP